MVKPTTLKQCTPYQRFMHSLRLRMVKYAQANSIRSVAREFRMSRNTVKKWLHMYKANQKVLLIDKPRQSINHPRKMMRYWFFFIKAICEEKRSYNQRIIATHIKTDYKIPYSVKTILKIIHALGYKKGYRKQKKAKRDCRAQKALLAFCERIQIDIKYLTDVNELKHSIKNFKTPKYQITARDVASGALWVCYSMEKTVTNTALFLEYLFDHLQRYAVASDTIAIQTDNGKEFTTWQDSSKQTLFEKIIFANNATHRLIPRASPTYNSDVEASHKLIDMECYSRMQFPNLDSFLKQTEQYQYTFNMSRNNAYKGGSPLEFLRQKHPHLDQEVLRLKPLVVDTLLNRDKLNDWRKTYSMLY